MNNKLDVLQDSVLAVHASVQRLTGKPPMEVLNDIYAVIIKRMQRLPTPS